MSKHTIEISDESGKSFKVVVAIGYTGNSIGNWRSLDKGFIRFNNGRAEYENAGTDSGRAGYSELTVRHLFFYENAQSQTFGLRLNDYADWLGVNDQGMGYLWQPWVLSLKPSRISWVLAD